MTKKITLDFRDTVNVALNKPARQSSVSPWSIANESVRAVTGEPTGSYSFHTAAEPNPWWLVDLLEIFPIEAIVIWNRDDEFAHRAKHIRIDVSCDENEWICVHRGHIQFGGSKTSRPLIHLLDGEVSARFIRLSLEAIDPLHLDFVEVLVSKNHLCAAEVWKRLNLPGVPSISRFVTPGKYSIVSTPADELPFNINALKLMKYGRFGNNFHQILNAAMVASALEIKDIVIFDDKLINAGNHTSNSDITFSNLGEDKEYRALFGHFYFVDNFADKLKDIQIARMLNILDESVVPLYSNLIGQSVEASEGTMHFHFRSGDIFSGTLVHGSYVQPPLSFYQAALSDAVARYKINRVVIVYEDKANPCVDAFASYVQEKGHECVLKSLSLREDIVELLGARVLCYGFGTFAEAITALSTSITAIYAFRNVESFPGINKLVGLGIKEILAAKRVDLNVLKDINGAYIESGHWRNSESQREFMLTFPAEALGFERD